jgi:thiamine pyrophosphokinase
VHAIVVADGDTPLRSVLDAAWPGWADGVGLVVAADGGARACETLGLAPDLLVGDFDSLGDTELAAYEARGVPIERAPADKDETDTELALRAVLDRGASRITVLGAFGGARLDHEVANLGLLALPELVGRPTSLLDARARVTLLEAPGPDDRPVERSLPGPVGGIVSLVPFGDAAHGVTTRGLRFALEDEPLALGPARGLSNVRIAEDATVRLRRGRLLVVESPVTLPGPGARKP